MNLKNLKWFGTVLCLIGIALTSVNIYPLNIIFGLVGSGAWTVAGYIQDDTPLILVEAIAALCYAFGLGLYVYHAFSTWVA